MSSTNEAPTGYHARLHDALHASVEMSSSPDPYAELLVSEMTDRQLLEETVTTMRTVGAALVAFQEMGPAQMMARMLGRK